MVPEYLNVTALISMFGWMWSAKSLIWLSFLRDLRGGYYVNGYIYVLIGSWWIGKAALGFSCFQLLVETWSYMSVQSTAHAGRVHWCLNQWQSILLPTRFPRNLHSLFILGIYPVISLSFCCLSQTKLYFKPTQLLKLHSITTLNCLVGNNFKVVVFCIPLALLSLFIWTAAVVASVITFHTSLASGSTDESVRCSVSC